MGSMTPAIKRPPEKTPERRVAREMITIPVRDRNKRRPDPRPAAPPFH
jgi:hypothetical protein